MQQYGRSEGALCDLFATTTQMLYEKFAPRLLHTLDMPRLIPAIPALSEAVNASARCLRGCWGFIDGTLVEICRPSVGQKTMFSGHKRKHAVKFQAIVTPDGLIVHMSTAFPGRTHDVTVFRQSPELLQQLEQIIQLPGDGHGPYGLYGDAGYTGSGVPALRSPHRGPALTVQQQHQNRAMSGVRVSVEWGFGMLKTMARFFESHQNTEVLRSPVGRYFTVAALLLNCRTCLHGGNEVSKLFKIKPPSLDEYLGL